MKRKEEKALNLNNQELIMKFQLCLLLNIFHANVCFLITWSAVIKIIMALI